MEANEATKKYRGLRRRDVAKRKKIKEHAITMLARTNMNRRPVRTEYKSADTPLTASKTPSMNASSAVSVRFFFDCMAVHYSKQRPVLPTGYVRASIRIT